MKEFQFFDQTMFVDMFESIRQPPERIIHHLPPQVSQSLSFLVMRIHQDVNAFVRRLLAFFSEDASIVLVFAFSTFPALFGFFTLDHFCHLASTVITKVLNTSSLTMLATELIRSFLFSAHRFQDVLWDNFFSKFIVGQPLSAMLDLLHNSFEKALPFLTKDHCSVLALLAANRMSSFLEVVFQDIFVYPLTLRAPHLVELIRFLDSCSTDDGMQPFAAELLSMITRKHHFNQAVPTAPHSRELQRVGFAMSDRDIGILVELYDPILREQASGHPLCQWNKTHETVGYAPFYFEIPIHVAPSERVHFDQPSISPEMSRAFAEFKKKAADLGHPVLSCLVRSPFHVPMASLAFTQSHDFTIVALQKFILGVREMFWEMTQSLDLIRRRNEVLSYQIYIEKTRTLLLDDFAASYVRERIGDATKVDILSHRLLSRVILQDFANEEISFNSWIAILNRINFTETKSVARMIASYRVYVSEVTEGRVLRWAASFPRRAQRLMTIVQKVRSSFALKYGGRLRAVMEAVEVITSFDAGLNKNGTSQWQEMFEFLVEELNPDMIFSSFLVWSLYLRLDRSMTKANSNESQTVLDHTFHGFLTMLVDYPALQAHFHRYVLSA
jgi:hypothetical protein